MNSNWKNESGNCRVGSKQSRHLFRIADQKLRTGALSTRKDTRTKLERGNVDAVLGGDLDDFIKAYLLSKKAA